MEQTVGNSAPELRQPLQVLAAFALRRDQLRKADELISRIESLPWETHVDLAAGHGLRGTLLAREGIAYSVAADHESAERSFQRAVQLVDSVPPAFRSTLGQVLYQAYSSFLKNTGKKQEARQLRNRGEAQYGRDTSGMTVSFDSLLRRH